MKLFKRLHSSGRKQNSSASFRSANKEVPAAGTLSSGSSTLSESSDVLSHSQPSPSASAQQNLLRLHSGDCDSAAHLRSSPLGPSRRQYLSVEVCPVLGAGAGAGNLSGSSGPSTPALSPSPSSSKLERRQRLSRQEATMFQEPAADVRATASGLDSQQGRQLPLECLATPARHPRNQQQLLLAPSSIGCIRRGPSDSDRSTPEDCRRRVKSSNTSTPPNSPSPSFMKEQQRTPKEVRASVGVGAASAASKQQSSGRFSILKLGRKLGFMRSKASASNISSYCELGSTGTSSQLSSVDQSSSQFGLSIDTESTACPPSYAIGELLDAGAEYKPQSPQSYRISRSFDVAFNTQQPPPPANAEAAASPVAEEKTPVETKRHIFQKKKKFSMGSAFDALPRRVPVPYLLPTLPITPAESMRSIECFEDKPVRCAIDANHNESSTDGNPAPRPLRPPRVPLIRTLDMSGAECDADTDTELFRASTSSDGGACYAELSIAVPAPDSSIKRSHSARFADSNPNSSPNPTADAGSGTTMRPRTTTLFPSHGPRLGPVAALLHSRSTAAIGAGSASKACQHAHESSCRSARVERSRSIAEAPCFKGPEQTGGDRNASPDAHNGSHSGVGLREESEEDSDSEEEEEDFRPATLERCYCNHDLRLHEQQCY